MAPKFRDTDRTVLGRIAADRRDLLKRYALRDSPGTHRGNTNVRFLYEVIVGLLVGGIFGYIGGALGGSISGYYSPFASFFDHRGKLVCASTGFDNGRNIGVPVGVICGGLAAGIGHLVPPVVFILSTGFLFTLLALYIINGLTESVEGAFGGIVGGVLFGAIGGYLSLYLLAS